MNNLSDFNIKANFRLKNLVLLVLNLVPSNCQSIKHSPNSISSCEEKRCKLVENDLEWQREEITNPSATCRCDDDCKTYADCCFDSQKFNSSEQNENNEAYKCVDVTDTGVLMKTDCPTPSRNTGIDKACRKDSWTDPLLALPVTSPKTYFTFKNIYCAICNNVKDFIVWDVNFYLSNEDYDVLYGVEDSYIINNMLYNSNTSSWGISLDGNFIQPKIYPKMPKTLKAKIRQCTFGAIDKCNKTLSPDLEVERLCNNYTFIVHDNDSTYRNPHCAECNGVPHTNLNCRKNMDRSGFFNNIRTLKDPINFYKAEPMCKEYEFYDIFTKKCRSLDNEIDYIEENLSRPRQMSVNLDYSENESECEKLIIKKNKYVISDTEVFIKVYNKTLSLEEVEIIGNGEILVCAVDFGLEYIYQSNGKTEKIVSFIGYSLSIFFLVLHLIIFFSKSSKYKLSNMNNASLSLSLIISYITLLIGNSFDGFECYLSAIISCYSLLTSFMWMSIISYDFWRVVKSTNERFKIHSGRQLKRFTLYSLLSLLVPGAIVGSAILADSSPLMPKEWKPAFGVHSCWFGQKKALIAFFVAPFVLTTLLNTVLFINCGLNVYRIKRAIKSPCKHKFKLYLRLALAMGLTWTTGLIAMSVNHYIFWYAFIILNSFQGVLIFISLNWKEELSKKMQGNIFRRISTKLNMLTTTTISNSQDT